MKAFLVLMAFLYMSSVSARGVTPFEKKDLGLASAQGKIVSVVEICPDNGDRPTCMAYGSTVSVKVTLHGCLDRLGGHFSNFKIINGKGYLTFGAINIFNSASESTRCVAPPAEIVKIRVPFEGDIELVNMDFQGTVLPQF